MGVVGWGGELVRAYLWGESVSLFVGGGFNCWGSWGEVDTTYGPLIIDGWTSGRSMKDVFHDGILIVKL